MTGPDDRPPTDVGRPADRPDQDGPADDVLPSTTGPGWARGPEPDRTGARRPEARRPEDRRPEARRDGRPDDRRPDDRRPGDRRPEARRDGRPDTGARPGGSRADGGYPGGGYSDGGYSDGRPNDGRAADGPRRDGAADARRPDGSRGSGSRSGDDGRRSAVPRTVTGRGGRRAKLVLKRIDPWSVFTTTLLYAVFVAVVIVVAVAVLFSVIDGLGILTAIDDLAIELDLLEPGQSLVPRDRVLTVATLLALVNVVLLTVLTTLAAFLYNLCSSFTGGIELTLSERDAG